jgi:hypothetical protein
MDVNVDFVERLSQKFATIPEIADILGVSARTLANRLKEPKFGEARARGLARARISIRVSQMRMMEAGNASMAIFLGKRYLGQRDVRGPSRPGDLSPSVPKIEIVFGPG